ncbi:MAP3K12-binding inhibitory protein 1-like isoform X2 [Littorina saxatilis]|uniref:MAP3K12-binding inhibitory protein 1-like isoform X2 n=1 Tax=Littorina saxatilis TaxID=31220 RepID=UPI0038B550CF
MVFGESCKEQLLTVLSAHKQKDEGECRRYLVTLIEKLQSISSTYVSKMSAPSSSETTASEKNDMEPNGDSDLQIMELNPEKKEVEQKMSIDQSLIQIHASKAEVERRIAAFIASKRSDVNDLNKRQFCFGLPNSDEENSCARVDSVFVSHVGSSSRLRVTRVFNTHGPQTQYHYTGHIARMTHSANGEQANTVEQSLEERLSNAEHHLKVGKDSKADMFSRLKALEERILFLEGLSPEYFQDGVPQPKRMRFAKVETPSEDVSKPKVKNEYGSLSEINERISVLQAKLKEKMGHMVP